MDSRQLSALLAELIEDHHVPGAQLAIGWPPELISVVAGTDHAYHGRPLTRRTRFPIGSITESFTATAALLCLADQDRTGLDRALDRPVLDRLPELRGHPVGRLCPRHLLSHTSGLPGGVALPAPVDSARQYVARLAGTDPMFPPGSAFSHSTAGFVLLGQLVAVSTGLSWYEAVNTLLCAPLGVQPRLRRNCPPALLAATGLVASAADLLTFGRAHLPGAGQPLPPELTALASQPVPFAEPFGLATGWGLGWALFGAGDDACFGRDDITPGGSAHLRVHPEGLVVALTTNATTGAGLWGELVGELRASGLPVVAAPPAPAGPPYPLDLVEDCIGSYRNGSTEYVVAPDPDGGLTVTENGVPLASLVPRPDLTFTSHDLMAGGPPHAGRFRRDPVTGLVDRLQLGGRLASRQPDPVLPAGRC